MLTEGCGSLMIALILMTAARLQEGNDGNVEDNKEKVNESTAGQTGDSVANADNILLQSLNDLLIKYMVNIWQMIVYYWVNTTCNE